MSCPPRKALTTGGPNPDKGGRLINFVRLLVLSVLALNTAGCGTFMAHSIARAPNRYPSWFAPHAPVTLAFSPRLLTNFVARYVSVGPPPAKLCYRVVDPADYHLKVSSTNWLEDGQKQFEFSFRAVVPGQSNAWTTAPRGTVLLLHGYGEAQFSMVPWALSLAGDGWRCVLVDLRGHGRSTGQRIYFAVKETNDMSQLLDALARDRELVPPVCAVGESYGAVLALRWQTVDPRLQSVVAIAPYANFSNTVMNIREAYAGWVPKFLVKAGLKKLPSVLKIPGSEFDTTTVLERKPVRALFIAGGGDKIAPVEVVESLHALALPGSEFIVVPDATHEALTYFFSELGPPVQRWLSEDQ
jgi:pimeloyl-ACP methyl ester carboxylesterase